MLKLFNIPPKKPKVESVSTMSLLRQHFMPPSNGRFSIQFSSPSSSSSAHSILLSYIEEWKEINANCNANFSVQSQINCKYHKEHIFDHCGCCQRILIIFKYSQRVKVCENIMIFTLCYFISICVICSHLFVITNSKIIRSILIHLVSFLDIL